MSESMHPYSWENAHDAIVTAADIESDRHWYNAQAYAEDDNETQYDGRDGDIDADYESWEREVHNDTPSE